MYPGMQLDEEDEYRVKPMNCPFHVLIYRSRARLIPRVANALVVNSVPSIGTSVRASYKVCCESEA